MIELGCLQSTAKKNLFLTLFGPGKTGHTRLELNEHQDSRQVRIDKLRHLLSNTRRRPAGGGYPVFGGTNPNQRRDFSRWSSPKGSTQWLYQTPRAAKREPGAGYPFFGGTNPTSFLPMEPPRGPQNWVSRNEANPRTDYSKPSDPKLRQDFASGQDSDPQAIAITLNSNVNAAGAISWREPASGYPLLAERTQRAARSTPESNADGGISESFGAILPEAAQCYFSISHAVLLVVGIEIV